MLCNFSKLSALLALPILAVATPWGAPTTTTKAPVTTTVTVTATSTATIPASSCTTGPVQCCNSVQSAGSSDATTLLGLLDVVVQDLSVPVGLTCSPINVLGIGSNSCSAQTVCCENNSFNGLVAIGCTPVNINL